MIEFAVVLLLSSILALVFLPVIVRATDRINNMAGFIALFLAIVIFCAIFSYFLVIAMNWAGIETGWW